MSVKYGRIILVEFNVNPCTIQYTVYTLSICIYVYVYVLCVCIVYM